MQPQEAFDIVSRHLFEQGKPAGVNNTDGTFSCRYRGPGRTRCAAGKLISDKDYRDTMEGIGIRRIINAYDLREIGSVQDLVADLQEDGHDARQNWTDKHGGGFDFDKLALSLREIAQAHGLSDAVVTEMLS